MDVTEEIDCLIVATVTPDMVFPATANIACDKLGALKMLLVLMCLQLALVFYIRGYATVHQFDREWPL